MMVRGDVSVSEGIVVSVPNGCFGLGYPEKENVRLNVEEDRWIRFLVANVNEEHNTLPTVF